MLCKFKWKLKCILSAGKLFSVLVVCIVMLGNIRAQMVTLHHPQIQFLFEDILLQQNSYHSIFRPIEIPWSVYDSILHVKKTNAQNPFRVSPVIDVMLGFENENSQFLYRFGQGIYASGRLGKELGFEFSAILYEQKFMEQNSYSLDSFKLVPGYNRYLCKSGMQAGYASIRGFIYWKPNQWLTFKAGKDKHFIGDGVRSFFLSENAAAYPFFQTRVNVWKINYVHQVLFMHDISPGMGSARYPKYATLHTLSFNASRKLNFSIFEAVIWRAQDSLQNRRFDVNYLNPFMFFRPAEYNMGSPDNVLMGIGSKWLIGKHSFIYGQLLLDEFRLKEIRANNGWWANKFAYQIGFKTFSLFKYHKSLFITEYNLCRPFTYSHTNTLQNYGYLNNALAHPMGSNFREILTQLFVECNNNWIIATTAKYARYGTDLPGTNLGSDLYKNQWTHTKYSGNYTGQGVLNEDATFEFTVSRIIKPSWRLRAFAAVQSNLHKSEGDSKFLSAFSVGINTWMYE